jgi:hypothetical protein
LVIVGVGFIEAVKLELAAGGLELAIDPGGGLFGVEYVGGGGEVDEVEALGLFVGPLVGVAEEEEFDLFAGEEDVHEGGGVDQAVEMMFGFVDLGLVVEHDDDGFGLAGVEGGLEPGELFGAEEAGGGFGFVEGVEEDEVGAGGGEEHDAAVGEGVLFRGDGGGEVLAVVVVAEGEVDGEAGLAIGAEEGEDLGVVFGVAGVEGAVAVDDDLAGAG